jgi:tRNA_anti-like
MISNFRKLAVLGWAVIIGLGCAKTDEPSKPISQPAGGGAAAKPDFTLSAEDLAREFLTDEKAAETKYKDKVVEVSAVVYDANQLRSGAGVFYLNGAKSRKDGGEPIHCEAVPEQKSLVPWLSGGFAGGKGQKVKVTGRVDKFHLGSVDLTACHITELEPPNTSQVKAEQVTDEFAREPEAAQKKYQEKEIIVEGTIADLVKMKDQFDNQHYSAKLEGAKPDLRVSCEIGESDFNNLKKGQKARFKGDCGLFPFREGELTVGWAFILKDK